VSPSWLVWFPYWSQVVVLEYYARNANKAPHRAAPLHGAGRLRGKGAQPPGGPRGLGSRVV